MMKLISQSLDFQMNISSPKDNQLWGDLRVSLALSYFFMQI